MLVPLAVVSWAVATLAFLLLAVLAAFFDRFPADERIAHAIQGIDVPAFGGFMAFVNHLGDGVIAVLLMLGVAVAFAVARRGWEAMVVILMAAPRATSVVIKEIVGRPRPSPHLINVSHQESDYSFPSGHTVGTAALFVALFFLIPAVVPWRFVRWLLQAGCVLVVLAAGPARVYVGVHWPSDVFAGYLLALIFLVPVFLVYLAYRQHENV
ncbi:MAG: phosphatase PAP2 family protein [Dehalococcoidia bacterium]